MVDDNESGSAASGQEGEQPRYRDIPPEVQEILKAHQKWVKSQGNEGKPAQLAQYDLSHLNLAGFDLRNANLQGANLQGANLQGTDLTWAALLDADLREVDLSGARGLLLGELGGADLSSARVPEDIGKFENLANLAVASKNTAQVFITMLAACVLSWLTVATTTDVGLLTNNATTPLPVIGTALPILGFYVAAPILLLAVYIYFHLNWASLWEGLAALPAIFPDGRRLDQAVYPWLLNGLVCRYRSRLQDIPRPFAWTQILLTIVLGWVFIPFTIILIWLRYLTRQDWLVTLMIIFLLAIAIFYGLRSFFLARRVLKGKDFQSQFSKVGCISASVILSIICITISMGSIYGVPGVSLDLFTSPPPPWYRTAVPAVLQGFSFHSFASLIGADFSIRPANWSGVEKDFDQVKGAVLLKRNFRYAFAPRAFFVRADLRWSNFLGANLSFTDLRQAILSGADFQGADLYDAKLQKADLRWAKLQGADLRDADFRRANLQEVDLQEASLQRAHLQEASLQGANLKSANLEKAEGLTREQLKSAIMDENTKLPDDLKDLVSSKSKKP